VTGGDAVIERPDTADPIDPGFTLGGNMITRRRLAALCLAAAAAMPPSRVAATELPVKPEKNPPGDIPDNQVFINYRSPLGFALKVPEGWARSDRSDGVVFADKYGRIEASLSDGELPLPSAAADAAKSADRAVVIRKAETVKRPAGTAIYLAFDSNSEPNAVTNKQIRLENDRYLFARNGKVATVTFSAPKGADNIDEWLLMSKSFEWK
jgi:hypothetical protein